MMNIAQSLSRMTLALVLVVATALPGLAQAPAQGKPAPTAPAPDDLHALWKAYVTPLLTRPIPTESQPAYYAGEMLQVPLHGAFQRKDDEWIQEFADHLKRMMEARSSLTDVDTSRLQYLYIASEFMVLASRSGKANLIPPGMPEFLYSDVQNFWERKPAWMWDRGPFPGGMRERLLWKLNTRDVRKSYYRAVLDADFYLFGIAADLRAYHQLDAQPDHRKLLNDVLTLADRVCHQEIKPTDSGGWVLQPGVWRDHPDFKFAGRTSPQQGMSPAPVSDITWDSSHFMRWPPIITSLMNAYADGSSEHQYYARLRDGLNTQFFSKIVAPPSADFPCYRMTNYSTGANGLYRWNYSNIGENSGYPPYKVSGALLIGWWGFLDSDQSRAMYKKMADTWPWPQECVDLYMGPVTKGRQFTAAEKSPTSTAMKFRYLLVRLASEL